MMSYGPMRIRAEYAVHVKKISTSSITAFYAYMHLGNANAS